MGIFDEIKEKISEVAESSINKVSEIKSDIVDSVNKKIDDGKEIYTNTTKKYTRDLKAITRTVERKKAPKSLFFIGVVGLIFSSLYLIKLFSSLGAFESDDTIFVKLFSSGFVIFIFFQYISYINTIFRLSSGMRGAWASMVRMSGTYIILMIVANLHILDFLPFDLVAFNSWLLMGVMIACAVLMFLPHVREFYTPGYSEVLPIPEWILLVFWKDPYSDYSDFSLNVDFQS